MEGRVPVPQSADLLSNTALPGVDVGYFRTVHGNTHLAAGVAAQHRPVLQQQGFHTHPGTGNGSRHTAGATAHYDHIVCIALGNLVRQTLDPCSFCIDVFHIPGGNIVKVVGQQYGGTAAKIAGQVVEGQGVLTIGQLHIPGNLPKPFI